jgi:hypothetical protein
MPDASGNTTASSYGDIIRLIERLHCRYLDVIRYELSQLGIDDINAVQALLLMNVQASEVSRSVSVGSWLLHRLQRDLQRPPSCRDRLFDQERSERDRRSVRIRATEKGTTLCVSLVKMEARHATTLKAEDENMGPA